MQEIVVEAVITLGVPVTHTQAPLTSCSSAGIMAFSNSNFDDFGSMYSVTPATSGGLTTPEFGGTHYMANFNYSDDSATTSLESYGIADTTSLESYGIADTTSLESYGTNDAASLNSYRATDTSSLDSDGIISTSGLDSYTPSYGRTGTGLESYETTSVTNLVSYGTTDVERLNPYGNTGTTGLNLFGTVDTMSLDSYYTPGDPSMYSYGTTGPVSLEGRSDVHERASLNAFPDTQLRLPPPESATGRFNPTANIFPGSQDVYPRGEDPSAFSKESLSCLIQGTHSLTLAGSLEEDLGPMVKPNEVLPQDASLVPVATGGQPSTTATSSGASCLSSPWGSGAAACHTLTALPRVTSFVAPGRADVGGGGMSAPVTSRRHEERSERIRTLNNESSREYRRRRSQSKMKTSELAKELEHKNTILQAKAAGLEQLLQDMKTCYNTYYGADGQPRVVDNSRHPS
ncbi:uncharacterized protein [Procambarus clarkii]|uniref:uncharacterized protein isoform X2 n=1 Tax=Procambarus clarkii TaxID=6728 RepID=UPI001E6733C2|nr:uncharacterized protein LOC123772301 isoform X2 [Procambarus clarkii]